MKTHALVVIACSFSLLAGYSQAADGYSFFEFGPTLSDSDGDDWTALNLEFVLPTDSFELNDPGTWESGLMTMPSSSGIYPSLPGSTVWNVAFTVPDNEDPYTAGSDLFLWGYDDKSVGDSEWILLSDPLWEIQTVEPAGGTPSFSFSNDTSALFGEFEFGVSASTVAAVPEPGTLMALALAVIAPVWLRMRRNARSRD